MDRVPQISEEEPRGLSVVESEREVFIAPSPSALGGPFVFGVLSELDFSLARSSMIDVDAEFDYDDWIDLRMGAEVGLSWAGVDSVRTPVSASSFLRWCQLSGQTPSEPSLDAFAAIAWTLENRGEIAVFACVSEEDFSYFQHAISAFAEARDFARWSELRDEARLLAQREGKRVEEMPIVVAEFDAWRACVGEWSGDHALDAYARLRLEQLTTADGDEVH